MDPPGLRVKIPTLWLFGWLIRIASSLAPDRISMQSLRMNFNYMDLGWHLLRMPQNPIGQVIHAVGKPSKLFQSRHGPNNATASRECLQVGNSLEPRAEYLSYSCW